MLQPGDELKAVLHREIEAAGPLSLARFMELVLYHPIYGYYQQPVEQIGCQGDFYTSVSAGDLFGRLLGYQCARWLDRLLEDDRGKAGAVDRAPFHLVEAGAHHGQLALDLLAWLEDRRPDLHERVEYWILEPSPARRQAQAERLARWSSRVRWSEDWHHLPSSGVHGVILSNELLDAFPVHRLGWDSSRQKWFEWHVGLAGDDLVWVRGLSAGSTALQAEFVTPFWKDVPPELLRHLPDGYTIEVSPSARQWWSEAAAQLRRGWLVTFDYGFEAIELLSPHRTKGTLRAYYRHQQIDDPFARPGCQDLTAHVNFSALREAGEAAGLETAYFGPQATFLIGVLEKVLSDRPRFGEWGSKETRQFQTLTHPEHLGSAFKVLLQSRATEMRR
ncbi:MAG: SAM-dependent methyltransferase [Verrucomicrobiota bacterium]